MNSFLYYLPGHTSQIITTEAVKKAGLSYAFPVGTPRVCNAMPGAGPDGGAGAILTDSEHYRFNIQTQTWANAGDFWVGYQTDSPPGPDDLIRKKADGRLNVLDGQFLELADEREWLIPVGRRWCEEDSQAKWYCNLPSKLKFGQSKQVLLGGVLPRYARLWAIAEADIQRGEDSVLSGSGIVYAAADILQANYKVGPAEIELLGLFTQDTPRAILDIFGDWDTYFSVEKKTRSQPDSPPSSNGQEATPPSIDQP